MTSAKWNGNIDWKKVKNSGIDFSIIRKVYEKENPKQIDKKFEENYINAYHQGVHLGVFACINVISPGALPPEHASSSSSESDNIF